MDIRLIDYNFAHATSCSNGDLKIYPKHFNWYRGKDPKDITVLVDGAMNEVTSITSGIKIWMLLEPPSIVPDIYHRARQPEVQAMFDCILTFDKALAASNPLKFKWYPLGGCWIKPEDRKIYSKTKNISIIASEKNYTEGHKLRHEIIRRYPGKIDVFGRGYNYIHSKLDALRDYKYTIVTENCQLDTYFSEKLIDPMMTGTIPIYWGSDKLNEIFGMGSIFGMYNLDNLVKDTKVADYFYHNAEKHDLLSVNYKNALPFVNTEDWLWENIFTQYVR